MISTNPKMGTILGLAGYWFRVASPHGTTPDDGLSDPNPRRGRFYLGD